MRLLEVLVQGKHVLARLGTDVGLGVLAHALLKEVGLAPAGRQTRGDGAGEDRSGGQHTGQGGAGG